jgi:thiol-disulfide isomerase/thioredoxin
MELSRRTILAAAATLATATLPRKPRAAEPTGPEIGQLQINDPPHPAPDLRWTAADGTPHRLSEYAGQGVILNFWATWCAPCAAEMPSLAALAPLLQADRIVVIPISTDATGAPAVQRFYAAHHIAALGIWLDPKAAALELTGALGLPLTLIIDRQGREAARLAGAADWTAHGTPQTLRVLCGV